MSTMRSRRRSESGIPPKLFFGLALIAVGVIFTLERSGIIEDAGEILSYWPVLLILAGLGKWVTPGSSSGRFSGGVLILIGSWLLAERLDWIDVSFWDWWPLALVLLGARMVWLAFTGPAPVAADSASTVNAVAVLGGSTRASSSPDFEGGDLIAFMGGCEIDLTRARITRSPAVIDAFAFWGGVEIRVPESWEVVVKGIPLLGGYEDSTRPRKADDEDALMGEPRQQLVVKGFAIMGGVDVKN